MEMALDLSQTNNINVTPLAKNLFDPNAAAEIFNETQQKGIQVDILINDAGQGEYGKFAEYDLSRDVEIIQLNITTLVSLTKLYLHEMLKRDEGRILQVASLLSKYPSPWMVVYGATKAFVLSFTEGLIEELKDTGVSMTALLPGAADTDFFHKAGAENTKTYREQRLSSPQDVAKDGYDALMKGERKIVSGIKNKIQAAISNVLPDDKLASVMREQMSPSHKAEGREEITHPASKEERERIEQATGNKQGDYTSI
jgi:short-subunit dehydrogenase